MKIAVLAIHGVLPIRRHTFADRVSSQMLDQLNARGSVDRWTATAVFSSADPRSARDLIEGPRIIRIHQIGDDAAKPAEDCYDVQEVYWSPLVRGKTTPFNVAKWLLMTGVGVVNSTARFRESPKKVAFDALLVASGLALGSALIVGSGSAAIRAWHSIADKSAAGSPAWQKPRIIFGFGIGVGAAYVLGLTLRSAFGVAKNAETLSHQPIQLLARVALVGLMASGSLAAFKACAAAISADASELSGPAIILTVGFAAFEAGLAILGLFLVDFFGPVEVYMARDENDALAQTRERVLQKFLDKMFEIISTPEEGDAYDRVHVLAHSLGSTIAMDGLLRLFDLWKQGTLANDAFLRIRSFVSFGTALEKTKFFFEANHPSFSQRFDSWRADLYGHLFTSDRAALTDTTKGIYWLNCWYFSDLIADAIASYSTSDVSLTSPTTKLVAENRERFGDWRPWHPVTHEDYLFDRWFWIGKGSPDIGVLDVITSGGH